MNDHATFPEYVKSRESEPSLCETVLVEIYVQPGFNNLEYAATTEILRLANSVAWETRFECRILSDHPGLIEGSGACLVHAERATEIEGFADVLLVLGCNDGRHSFSETKKRVRRMQRSGHLVVLFSTAATEYISSSGRLSCPVTTHWREAAALGESGNYPTLKNTLAENSSDVITSAGRASVPDLLLELLSRWLSPEQLIELSNELVLPTMRSTDSEQPKHASARNVRFQPAISEAIRMMENSISEPLAIGEISACVGISRRQMERLFKRVLETTPAQFYRTLRVRHARSLVENSNLSLLEIAVAAGFACPSGLASPFRQEFGVTPTEFRRNQYRGALLS